MISGGDLTQDRWELSSEFRQAIPEVYATLFLGRRSWTKPGRHRESMLQGVPEPNGGDGSEGAACIGTWDAALAEGAETAKL